MRLRVLTRYSVLSILKIGFITALLAALMLMGVDLFKNLDTYTNYGLKGNDVFKLSILYFPEAFLLGIGPSFLFAITYFLSHFHASNENICVLNSGIKYSRFLLPCIITGLLITVFYFVFNESIAISSSNEKAKLYGSLTYISEDDDNSDIAISDSDNGYLVYADDYIASSNTLYNVTIINKDNNGRLISRTNAFFAEWNKEYWILKDVYIYTPNENETTIEHFDTLNKYDFTLEPQLFKNLSAEVSKMSLGTAKDYLKKVKDLNPVQYASIGTEFYKRLLGCLTPLVMIIISCSLNYRFKKNTMFFSLICSICIAVVYYVIQMVTIMLADQGVIIPIMGMLIPFICIIILSSILSFILRK